MMQELFNMRDATNPVNKLAANGYILDWGNYAHSLERMLCECAKIAEAKGYEFFGLQFFGECWSGPGVTYARDGPSDDCRGTDFKACSDDPDRPCVGRAFTNYVYKVVDQGKTEPKVDGKWTKWTEWTICDKKCGGGKRFRFRECSNPEPSGGGAECPGAYEEELPCNTEKCEKVPCTEKLDIGLILDGSGSVSSANYIKMKQFIVELTRMYTVGANNVRFGALHYSRSAYFDFNLATYLTNDKVADAINKIHYPRGTTRTDLALKMAEDKFFCSNCGRAGADKALLVFTDGKSNSGAAPMDTTTANMKQNGVNIIAVGIGSGANKPELSLIASKKDDVLMIDDFKYMVDKLNLLLKLTCYDKPKNDVVEDVAMEDEMMASHGSEDEAVSDDEELTTSVA